MNILIKLFKGKQLYFFILLFYSLYYIITLISAYPIYEDEAWYASSAYNFSQGGWFISRLIGTGLPNSIFPLFEGIVFKIFGFSFFNARFTSFLFGVFSIIVFRSILQFLNIKKHIIYISLILFFVSPCYFSTFHIARPESAAVFFSLVSILYFIRSRGDEINETKNVCLCALFSGIAFLSHPYTFPFYFIFGFYYLVHFVRQKKFVRVLYFSIIAIFILLIFICNSYFVFRADFQLLFDRTSANSSVIYNSGQFFINFLGRKNLSNNGLLFIILAILPGLILWKNLTLRLISFASILYLIIASFIISSSHSGNHFMLNYIGLFTIISIATLVNIYDKKIVLLICAFYILTYSILNVKKNHNIYKFINNEINLQLNSKIAYDSNIYGDIRFWFMLPRTNYTAIYWNRYKKSQKELISGSDWILVCNKPGYNDITCYDNILQTIQEMNMRIDTVLNITTKQYGSIMAFKLNK
jgi:hypothetical protein